MSAAAAKGMHFEGPGAALPAKLSELSARFREGENSPGEMANPIKHAALSGAAAKLVR